MRVAIDIRRINEFGVGTYTRNAIRTLARLDDVNEYFLLGIPGKLGDIEPLPPNFTAVPAHPNEFSLNSYLELNRILQHHHCDLLHVPHLFWKPQAIPCPYVVTVHDLLDHLYRVNSASSMKRSLHFQFTKRVLHHAARIFAVSNFSKKDTDLGARSARSSLPRQQRIVDEALSAFSIHQAGLAPRSAHFRRLQFLQERHRAHLQRARRPH